MHSSENDYSYNLSQILFHVLFCTLTNLWFLQVVLSNRTISAASAIIRNTRSASFPEPKDHALETKIITTALTFNGSYSGTHSSDVCALVESALCVVVLWDSQVPHGRGAVRAFPALQMSGHRTVQVDLEMSLLRCAGLLC